MEIYFKTKIGRLIRKLRLMSLCFGVLGVLVNSQAETHGANARINSQPSSGTSDFPRCFDDPADIKKVSDVISANSKTQFKYDGYRKLLQSSSDFELMARLVYAETLAANCEKLNSKIAPMIAGGIANRVRLRGGDVASVVFQRDQFASSINIYSESRYKDFLCPKDARLWGLALRETKAELARPTGQMTKFTVNYFLYKHSPRWKKEPWQLDEDVSSTTSEIQDCIRFFKAPNWR